VAARYPWSQRFRGGSGEFYTQGDSCDIAKREAPAEVVTHHPGALQTAELLPGEDAPTCVLSYPA
jgi:hypothetical protein